MIKVYQTITDEKKGDCLRACVASMLELEIEQVPHFIRYDNWQASYLYFFASFGIEYCGCGKPEDFSAEWLLNGCIKGSVKSLNYDATHAVLMDEQGVVIHDPSLKKSYLGRNVLEEGLLLYFDMLKFVEGRRPYIPAEYNSIGDVYHV